MDAIDFLTKSPKAGKLFVLHGDEGFLKRQVIRAVKTLVLGDEADDQAVSLISGDHATFADVFDELDTVPFFFPKRVVIVDQADPFVSRYRGELEKRITALPSSGVLVLDVKTWASNTRLAKMVESASSIACKAPASFKLPGWCTQWAAARHGKQLPNAAASLLVDHVGADMGLLDQEIAKLAVYVGERARIDSTDVDKLVGNSRGENTWKIFDALAAGKAQDALRIVQRLFEHGEEPMRMVGAFSLQLRRLAQASRLVAAGLSLNAALEQVGVPPFAARGAEQQMRHLGRHRLGQLYDWLLQLNLDLRGNSSLPPRTLFERFVLKLASK